jgi:hypothetical protein
MYNLDIHLCVEVEISALNGEVMTLKNHKTKIQFIHGHFS